MCGIVGYVGPRDAAPILLEGLRRLEYRGYDSAGIAVRTDNGTVFVEKRAGKLHNLTDHLNGSTPVGHPGIAHTRWATHGAPNDLNAHPHADCTGKLALIHNGIIENYAEIRDRLAASGHTFTSETDTEVLAHLIEERYSGDLVEAVRQALGQVQGAYAIGVMHTDHPDLIVGARMNVPLIVGLGEGEGFLASDVPAILEHTRRMIILHEGDIAAVTPTGTRVIDLEGHELQREVTEITWNLEAAEKDGFAHFTLKEIYEQPHAIQEALRGRVDGRGALHLPELDAIEQKLRDADRIYLVACGTAHYASDVGAYLLQQWVGLPAVSVIGSEMRYAPPPITDKTRGHQRQPVRGDGRHDCPHPPGPRAGGHGRGRHQRGRQRADPRRRRHGLPPGRARDRGRLDQGLCHPGPRAPDGRPPSRPAARHADCVPTGHLRPWPAGPAPCGGCGPRLRPAGS